MTPFPYGATTSPRTPPAVVPMALPCNGCMNKAGELAGKNETINRLKDEAEGLREQITDLQAELNEKPPTAAEIADVRARMHLLADQEAAARKALAFERNALQDALGKLDRAERTIANRDELLAAAEGRSYPEWAAQAAVRWGSE